MSTKTHPQKAAVTNSAEAAAKAEDLGIALIAFLPLGWQVYTTHVASHTNPLILNGLEALETLPPDSGDTHNWLLRLDAKADLALAHAVLAKEESPLLKRTAIELYANRLRWVGQPFEGTVEMWLQIHPLAPPLVFPVRADGDIAYFIDLNPDTSEALERLLFRHHRRQIRAQREGG